MSVDLLCGGAGRACTGLRRTRPLLGVAFLFGTLVLVAPVGAQERTETRLVGTGLALNMDLEGSHVQSAALRDKIDERLTAAGFNAAGKSAQLEVRVRELQATISYSTPGQTVRRQVSLPEPEAQASDTIALLVVNVVSDEAGELLVDLQRAAPTEDSQREDAALQPVASVERPARGADDSSQSPDASGEPPPRFVNLSLFYPLALPRSAEVTTSFELGLLYSRVGAIEGFGLNPFVLQTERDVDGVALAGAVAYTGGDTRGVAIGGLVAVGEGAVSGVQLAGAAGFASGPVEGAQVSGLLARAGSVVGAQVSLVSLADRIDGAQIAGVNVAQDSSGAQLGLVNVSGPAEAQLGLTNVSQDSKAQLGLVNTGRDVSGLQLGLVNVGRRVGGTQIGLVNVADEVDGDPVGLVSITNRVRLQAVGWASAPGFANVGVKITNGFVYSLLHASYDRDQGEGFYATGAFLGVHFPLRPVFVDVDAGWTSDVDDTQNSALDDTARARALVGVAVLKGLEVFAGSGARFEIANADRDFRVAPEWAVGVQAF